jgi:hypothetical protein
MDGWNWRKCAFGQNPQLDLTEDLLSADKT